MRCTIDVCRATTEADASRSFIKMLMSWLSTMTRSAMSAHKLDNSDGISPSTVNAKRCFNL